MFKSLVSTHSSVLTGSYGKSSFSLVFLTHLHLMSTMTTVTYMITMLYKYFLSSPSLPAFITLYFGFYSFSQGWGKTSLWFQFVFSWCPAVWSIFPVINWPFVFLLLRTAYQCLLPISQLKWLHFVHFVVVVYVFTILILCWDGDGQIMLPILLDACSLSLLTISLVGRKFLNFM